MAGFRPESKKDEIITPVEALRLPIAHFGHFGMIKKLDGVFMTPVPFDLLSAAVEHEFETNTGLS